MAGPKAYVMVDDFAVDDVFDKAYKTSTKLKKAMTTAAGKAIDSASKLTTTAPKPGSTVPQFYLMGTLSTLTKEDSGRHGLLKAKVTMVIGTWPKKQMFGFPNGSAKLPVSNPKRIDDDVEELAVAIVKDLIEKKVIAAIEEKVP